MDVTKIFLDHVLKTEFSDFSETEIERAKYRLIDSFGVIAAGLEGDGNDLAFTLIDSMGGSSDAHVFFMDRKFPSANAAFMNSLVMRSFDFEVVEAQAKDGGSTPAHISGTSVPTALAVAEWKKVSGKKMLMGLLLGEDLAARLAASGLSNPFISPWDNTGTVNGLAAALIAGYIMGLDQNGITNAMGIALNQLSGSAGNIFGKTMAFKLPIALAARNGIFSAQLGGLGYTALKDPIAGKAGYYDSFCESYDIDDFLYNLGKEHYAEVVIKPYSACRATHPSIDAAIEIKEKHAPDLSAIKNITVTVNTRLINSFVDGDFIIGDSPKITAAFNLKYNIATALLRGEIRPENNTVEKMSDPVLLGLIDKIEVRGEKDRIGAALSVETTGGEKLSSEVQTASGDIFKKPLETNQIMDKYYKNMEYGKGISKRKAQKAVDFIKDIERKDDILPLVDIFK